MTLTKPLLRAHYQQVRTKIDPQQRSAWNQAIAERLLATATHKGACLLGLYAPIRGEVDVLAALIAQSTLPVALPVVEDEQLRFYRVRADTLLTPGYKGILEPQQEENAPVLPDTLAVPLLAFDRTGHRLGYGGGYYDRTLAAMRNAGSLKAAIGIAYACQETKSIPVERHDQPLNIVVTEVETIECRNR